MKLVPALQLELLRQDAESQNKIYIHKDGAFYHLYEWSAWLFKTIVGPNSTLTCLRYVTKKAEYVIAGFPLSSVGKYIADYQKAQPIEEGSDDLCITISPDSLQGKSFQELQEEFKKWKENQEVKTAVKSQKSIHNGNPQASALARSGLFSIVTEILSFPANERTPQEALVFISEMQQRIIKLL